MLVVHIRHLAAVVDVDAEELNVGVGEGDGRHRAAEVLVAGHDGKVQHVHEVVRDEGVRRH